jgi:predicted nucleic acid-binding protein
VPYYLDSSAFLKLLVREPETAAMRAWFAEGRPCWSSHLLVTEATRAGERLGIPREAVEAALDTVSLVLPAETTFHRAAVLPPPTLRSLDAVHLATALELGEDLEGVVSYDGRLQEGARAAGLAVLAPA